MSGAHVRCTVIVPTYDRPAPLRRCLAALTRLDYPRAALEVVVVDDGGSAPLEAVVAPFREQLSLRVLRQPNAGPAAARNLALARAEGELVAFTDDDCEPAPAWLRELAAAWRVNRGALIGGRTVDGTGGNPWAAVSQAITATAYDFFPGRRPDLRFFAANNLAADAEALRAVGGFDPGFRWSEDRELCHRWWHAGSELVEAPGALVVHCPSLDVRAFARQHFGYGRGAWHYQQSRTARGADGVGFEPRFHAAVLRRALQNGSRGAIASRLARLILWQVANTSGFVFEALRWGRRRDSERLPRVAMSSRDFDAA